MTDTIHHLEQLAELAEAQPTALTYDQLAAMTRKVTGHYRSAKRRTDEDGLIWAAMDQRTAGMYAGGWAGWIEHATREQIIEMLRNPNYDGSGVGPRCSRCGHPHEDADCPKSCRGCARRRVDLFEGRCRDCRRAAELEREREECEFCGHGHDVSECALLEEAQYQISEQAKAAIIRIDAQVALIDGQINALERERVELTLAVAERDAADEFAAWREF